MKLAVLTNETEKRFWDFVTQDYYDYYFFIYDWLLEKEKTEVFIALKKETIMGFMLIYNRRIVQLRGEPEAVRFLMEKLKLKSVELNAPINCEKEVLDKFPNFKQKAAIVLMSVKKGEENFSLKVEPQKLDATDAEEIALLMNESYPEMWSDVTGENVRRLFSFEWTLMFGIKREGKLVSFGYSMLTPQVSHIMWIATDKQCRNRGFATSIVSASVKECFNKGSSAIIYVLDDNLVAKNVYSKVGFKPCQTYLLLKT